jgi:hypothetical protein
LDPSRASRQFATDDEAAFTRLRRATPDAAFDHEMRAADDETRDFDLAIVAPSFVASRCRRTTLERAHANEQARASGNHGP